MPNIPCSNTYCDKRTDQIGKMCPDCQRIADEQKAKHEANKWRADGFPKSTDNHRRGWKKSAPR
jgi:hypothetical protein